MIEINSWIFTLSVQIAEKRKKKGKLYNCSTNLSVSLKYRHIIEIEFINYTIVTVDTEKYDESDRWALKFAEFSRSLPSPLLWEQMIIKN